MKEWSSAKKKLDISRSRGVSLNEILTYDIPDQSSLCDGNLAAEQDKRTLYSICIGKTSCKIDYNFIKGCNQKTAY